MQHLLVWSAAQSATVTDTKLTFITDPAVPTDVNGNPVLPTPFKLLAGAAFGTNISAARINSPYFRRIFLPYLYPLNGSDSLGNDSNIFDLRDHPMSLPALEGIEVDTSNGSGTNHHSVGLMISDQMPQQVSASEVYTVRCTAAITAVSYGMASGAITFGQTLPQGTYGLVGALVQSASIIFARFILPGQAYRPGVVGVLSVTQRPPFIGRKAPLGLMGVFQSTALPQLEVFCTAADSAQVIFLDLVKM